MFLCRVLLALVTSILLTGCAGNKIEGRKRERAAGYAELPPAQRQLVDQGKIDSGMSTNAVYVAWGGPATTVATNAPGTFTWIYVCRDVQAYRNWKYREEIGGSPSFAMRKMYSSAERETYYAPITYECAEVNFENYVVKSWREIPKPEFSPAATLQELPR
jgi:hypothetical protein